MPLGRRGADQDTSTDDELIDSRLGAATASGADYTRYHTYKK